MVNGFKNLYHDYEDLLIKNDKLSLENRDLKLKNSLLKDYEQRFNKTQKKYDELKKIDLEKDELLKQKDFEIARLKALLNIDSSNSCIPTSQTPINKKKIIPNTREKSNLPRGGQLGHPKHKLEKFSDDEINEICEHTMDICPSCDCNDIEKTGNIKEKDELDFKIIVEKKRHKFIEYKCKHCGNIFHSKIPNNLKEDNQYGPQIKALELTLMNQANVTINKAQKITYGMTNGQIDLSEGYIAKLQQKVANTLNDFMKEIKQEILKQKVLYWDDTVVMVDTSRACLRFYGNENLAMYTSHLKKDKIGLDEDGILQFLNDDTTVVHDHNMVNYNQDYNYKNAECNRHLISDLKKVSDTLNHKWSKKLSELLNKMNNRRNRLIEKGKDSFPQDVLNSFNSKFLDIMKLAYSENDMAKEKEIFFAGDETVLIRRILNYKEQYLLWIYNFDIPFTNNLSERSLRGVKSKQKASGQFWNIESAQWYAKIRSYIETCNRNNVNIYNALLMLSLDKPYTLNEILNNKDLKNE